MRLKLFFETKNIFTSWSLGPALSIHLSGGMNLTLLMQTFAWANFATENPAQHTQKAQVHQLSRQQQLRVL